MANNLIEINEFLTKLAKNNSREWMTDHKSEYQHTRKIFEGLISELIAGISLFDDGIVGLLAKKSVFRLHRDTRFSNDKSPYKLNYGASITRGGRKSPFASYYIHLKPGDNFIGGGMYMPEAEELKKIRQEIDYNSDEFLKIVKTDPFRKVFGEMQGDKLKTAPKGYPKDHAQIELLRHKGFYFLHKISDRDLGQEDFVADALEKYRLLHPFISYMNTAID